MTDICCIGHITRDKIITQRPPNTVYCAGGSAFYIAWALQALPQKVSFHMITSVSREIMPEVERLRKGGIRVTAYESPFNVFFENTYGENMDDRTQRVLAKSDSFTLDQLRNEEAKVFHLGTLLADDFAPEVVDFLAKKGDVSIDVQGYLRRVIPDGNGAWKVIATDWSDKLRLLRHTAILKVNEQESLALTGLANPHTAAEQIQDWGVREVIITLGSGGSVVLAEGRFYEVQAYPPQTVVDATGCGDTYSAGYLYCRAQGMDYIERCRFAAAMCTLKLEHTGPFEHTIDDVHRIINGK